MLEKLLIFTKLLLKSFIYELAETFCFPKGNILKIYNKYNIEKVHIYHILTDTDSTLLKFVFVSYPNSDIPESKYRHILFKTYTNDLILLTLFGKFVGYKIKTKEKN